MWLSLVAAVSFLLTPWAAAEAWTSVEDAHARLRAPQSVPWASTTQVCFRFENTGNAPLALPSRTPFRIFDAEGHFVFSPASIAEGITLAPGAVHEACWDRSSHESSADVLEHGATPWTATSLAGIAAPGGYSVVWRYFAPGWTPTDLQVGFVLEAPLE